MIDLPKPALLQPCNGCGKCCREEVCDLGEMIFGADTAAPCPALIEKDGRAWCGIILGVDKAAMNVDIDPPSDLMKEFIGIGQGCSMEDFPGQGQSLGIVDSGDGCWMVPECVDWPARPKDKGETDDGEK